MSADKAHLRLVGNYDSIDAPSYDQLIHCMRCGLCLPVCPTFSLYQLEKTSPRGRLALMLAVSEERMEVTEGFEKAMNLCLGCLACQTACPAGVPFGQLLERARHQAEVKRKTERPILVKLLRNWVLKHVVYSPHGLEPWMPLFRFYQKLRLQRLHLTRFLPGYLGDWEGLLPLIPEKSVHHTLGEILPAQPPVRGRVGLLTGCLENALLANMGLATARVLAHNGFEVVIPQDQVCCGALPGHIGELDIAREQARRNLDVFTTAEVDFVVSDAAGCSAQLKEYAHLLKDDLGYAHKAQEFISKTRDATELLADYLPLRKDMNRLNLRVAYDDPCHLMHSQGISKQPRELLRSIPGLELIELPEASWCCGSAGTYNLTHGFESHKLLERKIAHVQELNVNTLATANTGCYLQLEKGVRDMGINIEVIHVVELLARAYGLV